MFALIDGNNFYCSCESALRPSLRGHPLIVASNNDGCAIARNQEAKALGVKMGQPLFELRDLMRHKGLIALSANFELYGDMSDRMMTLAAGLGPVQEIYSIDECFIGDLAGVPELTRRAWTIRSRIERWIGIQTCVGLAPTKTLAKLCNHIAKESERKPGSYPPHLARVCNWQECSASERSDLLQRTPAGEVWGIGRRIAAQLAEAGFITAWDVANMPAEQARTGWSVVLERTVRELQGISCISLELAPPPKKQIAVTRSFGHAITTLPPLVEAVSEFASKGAEKLRRSGLRAGAAMVFVRTSPFRPGPKFYRTTVTQLQPPTADTSQIVNAALSGLRSIYAPGYQLAKAGVLLLDLAPAAHEQLELLQEPPRDQSTLMEAVDRINARYGRGAIHMASTGMPHQDDAGWRMKQEMRTPRCTTRLDEIPIVRA
ncbi:Y-family DNA polymerase [Comamonas terrigena]|jgi:DNA polymerase V|uniref:Y-family DNA polymerase n=1 Tax=Comamonas terrigena TaxID=32013 RepID=UPI002447903E|nr:Y-family DNA polymerase [Comamonas terrigena]MDH0051014.1 Y-family DNA polymerase [Comamonas terrigena]MDH0513497.1 Y-family DNA polymerase [Comamonas terrigena]MDH1092959.1 Y-family DNA polymerase [Comamonas terrigena]